VPRAQTFPHMPQLARSRFRFVHVPPPQSALGGAHVQLPPMHERVTEHALPQKPQLSGFVVMSTHALPQRSSEPGHVQ